MKFSGFAIADSEGPPRTGFLADAGSTNGPSLVALSYPIAVARRFRNLATNVLGFIIPVGGSILVELLVNGSPVPGFATSYGSGESGIKSVSAGPFSVVPGDTFDLRTTTAGLTTLTVNGVSMSATLGVE